MPEWARRSKADDLITVRIADICLSITLLRWVEAGIISGLILMVHLYSAVDSTEVFCKVL